MLGAMVAEKGTRRIKPMAGHIQGVSRSPHGGSHTAKKPQALLTVIATTCMESQGPKNSTMRGRAKTAAHEKASVTPNHAAGGLFQEARNMPISMITATMVATAAAFVLQAHAAQNPAEMPPPGWYHRSA
eukprot:CAMPEP_0172921648 /NCGR_PEP_ID=MMETSP1075-20121228/206351_1 /TAXON_ID=2916 /ORGANISM="Ceratium fusus, Strain PA161109" /LENGTH=129 /DNA_ID=CAMNT_0013781845 /DNA_START=73 /DNA_END=463 /DNA_ORIENTATION=+